MEDIKKIRKLLKNFFVTHKSFQDCEIEILKSGHNRTTYLLTNDKGKKYIVKKGNESKDLGSASLVDVRVQSFLKSAGCDFIPKIIYYDEKNDLYIESHVGDYGIRFSDLSDAEMITFIQQLVLVHSLNPNQYKGFAKEKGFEEPVILSLADTIQVHGFDRFKIVKELCPDQKVKDWIETHLQQNIIYAQDQPLSAPHLKWGDIGENLRKDESKLYFIDWEFSRLGFGSELAYIKIHSHLPDDKFSRLVALYATYSGRGIDELLAEIDISEKITRTNDVIWAAMKWCQSESSKDAAYYKDLTYKRIELAEKANK